MDALERFAATLNAAEAATLGHVRDYRQWLTEQRQTEFEPGADDDVFLRTYLTQRRAQGAEHILLRDQTTALKRFYAWAQAEALISSSPFDQFNFDRPFLRRDQIRRRESALDAAPHERELLHLRALNRLAEQLNRSADVQTALDATLTTLVDVMHLRTAWAFVTTESGLLRATDPSPHDFALVAACGLPPGLARDNGHYLRCSPDCHCQYFLRSGYLVRAVNVVECTRLMDSAEANGDNRGLLFHASAPLVVQDRMLGIVNVATEEWQFLTAADLQFLTAVGAQAAVALERAQLYDEMNTQHRRLERELVMAREVQASLLPQPLPKIPGFSLAAEWRSAREMGGDFYDVFALPDGRWALVIADVSDKGAPAALYMAMTRSLIRAGAGLHASPAAVLQEVNQQLRAHCSSSMFVTVFYAVLDAAARALTYASAGHNPPLLRRAAGSMEMLTRTGLLLGVLEELALSEAHLTLAPGDMLVAYTDGVTDALNPQGEEYGLTRFSAAVAQAPAADAARQLAHLSRDLAAFTGDVSPFDDITWLIVAADEKA